MKDKLLKLVLFDIDGTILNCHRAGKESLVSAVRDVYGTTGGMENMNFQGKTDLLILYESLIPAGINRHDIDMNISSLKKTYFEYLRIKITGSRVTLLPGIKEIIAAMKDKASIMTGLLTGNFSESAYIKLNSHSLGGYFEFGVFGCDAVNRNDMPGIARKKLADEYSLIINFKDMVIIGDTVYDIECAKKSGAVSVSVGTGWTEREILLKSNPDFYFNDLSDTSLVMDSIFKN